MKYNEDGGFEQQQAQKLSTLIKKEIPRAATAEARFQRQQEEREEAERQAECSEVLDQIMDLVVKVEEKRLIRVDRERKKLMRRQQV